MRGVVLSRVTLAVALRTLDIRHVLISGSTAQLSYFPTAYAAFRALSKAGSKKGAMITLWRSMSHANSAATNVLPYRPGDGL
jgi:hypothetical protein